VAHALTSDQALERAREAGIQQLALPTPFAVGRVNCYLLEDEPLTLIDTGPNSGKALDELEHRLAELGHSIDDLELVILTHQHIDHIGLTEIIVEHSGAEVAAIDVAVSFLENFGEGIERDDSFAAQLMLRNGIPEDVVRALASVSASFRAWGSRPKVTRPLRHGETMQFRDRSLEVMHRPGHSPSDTVFWDAERRILFAADHLIQHISSNALLTPSLDGSGDRPQALVTYIDSLRKTRELPAEIVLPGHGDAITDHVGLIDDRLVKYEHRKEKIFDLIAAQPRTAYELAQAIWGNIAVRQAFLTLSEVVGHVDLLVNEGRVREVEQGSVVRYEATADGQ
jgi:glyoxylase-like metal-dependent hydrolase (beta-lactamase superfamily II)